MKLAASVVLGVLAATAAAGAEDANAPLADAKQQLQQLQRDQAAAKSGAADSGLKGSLPEVRLTMPGRDEQPATAVFPNRKEKDQEKARKQAREKNWLVDGYNRLGGERDAVVPGDQTRRQSHSADALNDEDQAGEHDDLINLYEHQSKSGNGSPPKGRAAEDKKDAGFTAADPMAPFLQQWLANSPVRDVVLATRGAGNAGGGTPDSLNGPGPGDSSVVPVGGAMLATPVALPAGAALAAENPYLAALSLPVLPAGLPPGLPTPPPAVDAGMSPVSADKPAVALPGDSAATAGKNDLRKPPVTPADEDKKYFPQLKRF